jgi:glycosyltransferase involved in cell wall biosynthesis
MEEPPGGVDGAADGPRLTVCVVAYNQAPYLGQCLDSILAQEVDEAMEIVVGDDGSTDGSRAIAEDYARRFPDRVRVVGDGCNRGASANYFATHAEARGEFVAHIDGDDYMLPGKLQAQLDALRRHPECAVCAHDCMTYDQAAGRIVARRFFRGHLGADARGEAVLDLAFLAAHLPFFAHSTKMYRRAAAAGLASEGREMIDCHWHLYHAAQGPIVYLDRALGVYRQGVGVSHHAGAATVLNTRVPSLYLRATFADAVDYGRALGAPAAALARSAARTYCRWAIKFALAGQAEEFARYARLSRGQARLGPLQWLLGVLAGYPGAARPLARLGAWGLRAWRWRLAG